MALAQDIINRVRQNPLNDFDEDSPDTYVSWTKAELTGYLNEARDELCKETLCLTDSDTPGICVHYIGINASWFSRGTNAATLKSIATISFWNNGKLYTFPIKDNIPMSTCLLQPVSTFCIYLISTDALFNVTITQGVSQGYYGAAVPPDTPIGNTPLGLLFIATDGTHAFTSGTTSLNHDGIAAVFLATPYSGSLGNYSFIANGTTSANSFIAADGGGGAVYHINPVQANLIITDPRVIRVCEGQLDNSNSPMSVRDQYWMNQMFYGWKRAAANNSKPRILVSGQNVDQYILWPPPKYPDRLVLTVKRRPLVPIGADLAVPLEIRDQYCIRLVSGIAYRAYQKQGEDTFDAAKSLDFYGQWQKDIEAVKREEIRMNQQSQQNYMSGAFTG